ncbi:MAG: hypothetical protein AAGJ40_01095 [Planctomycetota bacterium]
MLALANDARYRSVAGKLLVLLGFLVHHGNLSAQSMLFDRDPATEQLVLKSQGGPEAFGSSLSMLTRAGSFEAANQLLESAAAAPPPAADQATSAAKIAPRQRLQLLTSPEVSPTAKAYLEQLFASQQQRTSDPKRLRAAMDSISQSSPDRRLDGLRSLFEGVSASVAELVSALVKLGPSADDQAVEQRRDQILRVSLRIDSVATVSALRRLALYGSEGARAAAVAGLARIDPAEYLVDLITALHARDSSPIESQVAQRVLSTLSERLPNRASAIEALRRDLQRKMFDSISMVRSAGRNPVWIINPSRDGVAAQSATAHLIGYRDAADAAARLMRLGDTDTDSLADQWVATIAYRVVNDPDWGDDPQIDAIVPMGHGLPAWFDAALSRAVEKGNEASALGLIRLAGKRGDVQLLLPRDGGVSPLTAAVDHAHAGVRFEAARVIADLISDRDADFAGMSRVRRRWAQMSRLQDRPLAVVLENRPDVTEQWVRILDQFGYATQFVSSVADLETVVSRGHDLRLIAAKEYPLDASAIEMIDVVRRIQVARRVPIMVYTRPSKPAVMEAVTVEMSDAEVEIDMSVPDEFGVMGGIENIEGYVERDLLNGDLDMDWTIPSAGDPRRIDLERLGNSRWGGGSRFAGMIQYRPRVQSSLGLYELLTETRQRRHLPPLSAIDRQRYRQVAVRALSR